MEHVCGLVSVYFKEVLKVWNLKQNMWILLFCINVKKKVQWYWTAKRTGHICSQWYSVRWTIGTASVNHRKKNTVGCLKKCPKQEPIEAVWYWNKFVIFLYYSVSPYSSVSFKWGKNIYLIFTLFFFFLIWLVWPLPLL